MNYVARLKRTMTVEESEQSEISAMEKITRAFDGLANTTDSTHAASSNEIAAMKKMAMAYRKVAGV